MSASGRHSLRAIEKRYVDDEENALKGLPPSVPEQHQQQPEQQQQQQRNDNNNSTTSSNYQEQEERRYHHHFKSFHRSYSHALCDTQSELRSFLSTDKSLNSIRSLFYSLALEPHGSRRERILMAAEAYAIFGALFLNGIWFIWEFGHSKEFPNNNNDILKRVFNLIISIGLIANIMLALFAGTLWLSSILYSNSHNNWAYGSRHMLTLCQYLMITVVFTTMISTGIAVYNALEPHLPEMIIGLLFLALVCNEGSSQTIVLAAGQTPLEFFHMPWWFRSSHIGMQKWKEVTSTIFPANKESAEILKASTILQGAKERAELLRNAADREEAGEACCHNTDDYSSNDLYNLLRVAATKIGRIQLDVTPFCQKLEHDLYDDVDSLMDEDVEILSKYMPRRLAKEVFKIIHENDDEDDNALLQNKYLIGPKKDQKIIN